MIEIKTVGGRVLYVATTSNDVKSALVEAVYHHADLQGADLRGADLQGAYLQGADLRGADLQGADLQGAYLQGADLQGADLQGADLQGAYLRGADLQGADLQGADWAEVATALTTALQAMNDGGRHWIKGALERGLGDGSHAYCSIGSVEKHSDGTVRALALWLIQSATAGSISDFNDHEGTTWDDVQQVFGVAIRNAQRFAAVGS